MIDRLRDWRNALLGRPEVRRRLAYWPFGRRIEAAHATRLFAVVTGFARSQMLAAAVDLGCFDRLAAGPLIAAEIADLPPAGGRALVAAMIASGLWERRTDGRIGLSVDGIVIATDPGIRAMIAHHRLLYADLADPVALLQRPGSGMIGAFWPYASDGAPADYSALMAASRGFVVDLLLTQHDFARCRHVMDVGGGDGGFVMALALRYPALRLTLVDLPPVADLARARIAAAGFGEIAVEGRSQAEPLPSGADAITLVRLLHDLDDGAALALLRRVAAALPKRGRVIVAEPMRHRGRDPVAAYFAAYFTAMGSGRLRSPDEVRRLLCTAGLTMDGYRRRLMLDVVTARRI